MWIRNGSGFCLDGESSWRTLQRAAVNFSSPFYHFQCPIAVCAGARGQRDALAVAEPAPVMVLGSGAGDNAMKNFGDDFGGS
jgi:hypothetical protein